MTVNATKVVEAPAVVVAQKDKLTGEMPPPPPPPPADAPILVVEEVAVPVQVAHAPAPALPKTGSDVPRIGLLGFFPWPLHLDCGRSGKADSFAREPFSRRITFRIAHYTRAQTGRWGFYLPPAVAVPRPRARSLDKGRGWNG